MRVEIAASVKRRLRGLFGRESFTGILVLAPCNDVHTVGMRREIDIAFVSPSGVVLSAYRNVGPRHRVRCKGACATLERFSTQDPWFECGDRIDLSKKEADV